VTARRDRRTIPTCTYPLSTLHSKGKGKMIRHGATFRLGGNVEAEAGRNFEVNSIEGGMMLEVE